MKFEKTMYRLNLKGLKDFVLTSPLKSPLASKANLFGCFFKHDIASLCPSRLPINGLANTLSSFTALRARTYSLGASKGCKLGS